VIEPVKSSLAGSIVRSTVLCVGRTVVGSRSSGGVGSGRAAGTTVVVVATGGFGVLVATGGEPVELQATTANPRAVW
jgi:hypothetical protein